MTRSGAATVTANTKAIPTETEGGKDKEIKRGEGVGSAGLSEVSGKQYCLFYILICQLN